MGDPLGSSAYVSSQKQKREGVVEAQSGQYRTMMEPIPGCDNLVSEPIPGRKCADKDVGPLRGWIVRSHIVQGSGSSMPYMYMPTTFSTRHFGSSLASSSVGTPKLSENGPEHSLDG